MSIQDDVKAFLSDEDKDFAESTQATYGYILRLLDKWLTYKSKSFDDLTTSEARTWINDRGWGPAQSYGAAVAIRSFAAWRYGKSHPLARFRLSKPDMTPHRTLTKEQAEQLLSYLANRPGRPEDLRNVALVALMLDTGLRASEVCRLQLARLDLGDRILSVLGKGSGGGKWRTCVFTEQTRDYLIAWLKARAALNLKDSGYVFVSSTRGRTPGGHLTTGGLRAIFRKMGKRAGLPGLSPHDLRRSMATLGIQSGAPSRLIQKQGGWTSLSLLERYTQALQPHDVDSFLPMGNLIISGVVPMVDILKPSEPRTTETEQALSAMHNALQGLAAGKLHVAYAKFFDGEKWQ